jgi:hypothetical protein
MTRAAQISLIAFFLGIIFGVPIVQVVLEIADDETPQFFDLFEQAPTEEHLRTFEKALEENSFFELKLRSAYQLVRYFALRDLGKKVLIGRDGWYFHHPGVKYLTQPYFKEGGAKPEGEDPVLVIRDFARQLQKRDIRLLVVIVPGKASIYPERLSPWAEPERPVYANTTRFKEELIGAGVEVLDLHALFLNGRKQADLRGQPLYMATDTHWTGQGILLAAGHIAERVKAEPWYTNLEHPVRYRRHKAPVARRGDLLRMTRIPMQEELFKAERVDCYRVSEQIGGQAYQDDDLSPILLLGDSFSRVFQTDAPRSAGLIANLAYELQMPLASIVNDGGASTLVRQQLARRLELLEGKRLVIWEFAERDIRFGLRGWQPIALEPD